MKKQRQPAVESCCPITKSPRLRLASDAQTDSIRANFPDGIPRPALRALYSAGLMSLADLTRISEEQLSALHGMGPRSVRILKQAMESGNLSMRSAARPN